MGLYVMSVPSGYVKIGVATDARKRRARLQIGCPEPITLRAWIDPEEDGVSSEAMEREIHGLLARQRLRGEWFRDGEHVDLAEKIAWARLHPRAV